MQDLNITLIQYDIQLETKKENLAFLENTIVHLKGKTDIIALPEMFSTGFSMSPILLAETMNGFTINWMLDQAEKCKSIIMGSCIIKENMKYFNRLVVAFPDGQIEYYDKNYLYSPAG